MVATAVFFDKMTKLKKYFSMTSNTKSLTFYHCSICTLRQRSKNWDKIYKKMDAVCPFTDDSNGFQIACRTVLILHGFGYVDFNPFGYPKLEDVYLHTFNTFTKRFWKTSFPFGLMDVSSMATKPRNSQQITRPDTARFRDTFVAAALGNEHRVGLNSEQILKRHVKTSADKCDATMAQELF